MVLKCSECGGEVRKVGNTTFICTRCGRERKIEDKPKIINMSETANLDIIME